MTSAAGNTGPSPMTAPWIDNSDLVLVMYSCNVLATSTGSSYPKAIAVGPCTISLIWGFAAASAARCNRVFFMTTNSTPASLVRFLSSFNSLTFRLVHVVANAIELRSNLSFNSLTLSILACVGNISSYSRIKLP